MDLLKHDLRYAWRSLRRRPGFTALAVLTLALGIGVNTVAFNAVNSLLLRPFWIPDGDRLGWIMVPAPGNPRGYARTAEFEMLARETRALDRVEAEARVPVALQVGADVERAWALLVSPTYLRTFHVRMTTGRPFDESDLRGDGLAAVVSHRFWAERLGRPESLAGTTIVVANRIFSVVGVVADDFQGPGGLYTPDLWLPLDRREVLDLERRDADAAWLTLFGRIAEGATYAQAESEITNLVRLMTEDPEQAARRNGRFHPMSGGHPDLREIGPVAWLAFGAVNVVLLIACFNLSSLLIARAAERRSEIAVRYAVGASRTRIVRQLLTESFLLSTIAAAAALIVAMWSRELLSAFSLPAPIPQRMQLRVGGTVIAFAALLALVAAVVPALLPALQSTRGSVVQSMRGTSIFGGRSRIRAAFVVAQIAGSTAFVLAAALFVRSFLTASAADPGFDTTQTAMLEVAPSARYTEETGRRLYETLQQRASHLPQVRHAALADRVPFFVGAATTTRYSIDGDCRGQECPAAGLYHVGPGYFSALGIPLRAGREFMDEDVRTATTVVVSEHLASRLWPGEDAVGRIIRIGDEGTAMRVVGVAADIRHRNLSEPPGAYVYRALTANEFAGPLTLIVRTHGDPRDVLAPLRDQLRAADPELPPVALMTMRERMKLPMWPARTAAGFFVICGSIALLLATIGLFGVMYFTIAQRTREFGIRIAVGATRNRVVRVVLGEALRLAIPGVLLGIVLGYIAGQLLSRGLHGVTPADPLSLGAAATLQLLVALAACALPAYRAAHADPIAALRQE